MIDKPALDCKYPVGNGIDSPEYHSGVTNIVGTKTASFEGENVSTTASDANLSAKWKGGAQDVPAAGRNQYQ